MRSGSSSTPQYVPAKADIAAIDTASQDNANGLMGVSAAMMVVFFIDVSSLTIFLANRFGWGHLDGADQVVGHHHGKERGARPVNRS